MCFLRCVLSVEVIFFAVSFEPGRFGNAFSLEQPAHKLLVFGTEGALQAVEAVIGVLTEMGYELSSHFIGRFVGHFVQQVLDAPSHAICPDFLEIGAGSIGGDTVGVDDGEGGVLRGAVFGNEVSQAAAALGTSVVEAVRISVGHRLVVKVVCHMFFMRYGY